MTTLPPFPVDDQTLDLLSAAVVGTEGKGGRSSISDLCVLYSQLAGSDTSAIDDITADGTVIMRDSQYHPNDIIAALIAEVRRLHSTGTAPSLSPEADRD